MHEVIERVATTAKVLIDQVTAINDGRAPRTSVPVESASETNGTDVSSGTTTPDAVATPAAAATTEPESPDPALFKLHALAERFFVDQLPGSWVPGYLASRGLAPALDDAAPWAIGYAPATWTALVDHLRTQGHAEAEIITSGLGKRSTTGGLIDRFRDRAMIPVRTPDGTTIAFIGRANPDRPSTADHPIPKYLNSPQTPLYTKGAILYGLDVARPRLAAGAIPVLVEGTLDAIAVTHTDPQARYAAVAPSGTALTRDQIAVLSELVDLTDRGVLVAFDGDTPGQQAATRAHDLLRTLTPKIHRAVLSPGSDPAGILESHGPHQLTAALAVRRPLAELVLDAHLTETRAQRPWERRDQAITLIADLVPEAIATAVAMANQPGTGDPVRTTRLQPIQAVRLLPATTLALIIQVGEDIHVSAPELTNGVVNAITDRPSSTRSRSPGTRPRRTMRDTPYGLVSLEPQNHRATVTEPTRPWPPSRTRR